MCHQVISMIRSAHLCERYQCTSAMESPYVAVQVVAIRWHWVLWEMSIELNLEWDKLKLEGVRRGLEMWAHKTFQILESIHDTTCQDVGNRNTDCNLVQLSSNHNRKKAYMILCQQYEKDVPWAWINCNQRTRNSDYRTIKVPLPVHHPYLRLWLDICLGLRLISWIPHRYTSAKSQDPPQEWLRDRDTLNARVSHWLGSTNYRG